MKLPEALADLVAESRAVVRFGYPWWLRPFLGRGVAGITLGRTIYLRAAEARPLPLDGLERLVRHELAHVRQVNRLGLPMFLIRYLSEFLGHLVRERSLDAAYRKISFEVEAAAAEQRL